MSRKGAAGAAKAAIDLYFDVRSPYSWIAFESMVRYRNVWPIDVQMKPALLGGILRDAENLRGGPPLNNKLKGDHMYRDLKLLGDYWGIPFKTPKDPEASIMKQSTVLPLRFLLALDHRKEFEAAARGFWQRVWASDQPVGGENDVREVAKEAGISNVDELLKKATTPEVKEKLKTNSDAVVGMGGFGLPWITVKLPNGDQHQVFGSDRLPIIGHLIGERYQGPLIEHAGDGAMKKASRI